MSDRKVVRVRDVMKPDIDIVQGMMTVKEALHTMKHIETKALIVDKRNEDDEYGIVLLADIAKHVLATDRAPERVNVYEVMRELLLQLWTLSKGSEATNVLDVDSPSVCKAFDEFHNISRNMVRERRLEVNTIAKPEFPETIFAVD